VKSEADEYDYYTRDLAPIIEETTDVTKRDETYVFVYGTLKRGNGNHRLLKSSRFISTVGTKKTFMMFGGGFPLCREPVDNDNHYHAGVVKGELFAVDDATLARLDRLEGHPNFYERRVTEIEEFLASKVWMYHWNSDGRVEGAQHVPKRGSDGPIHDWKPGRGW